MPIDFAELARMVRKDRGAFPNQTTYGRLVGLAQGQVSDLELAKVRKLSHEVRAALEKRFGELPQISEEPGDAPESMAGDISEPAPLEAYRLEVRGLREQLVDIQRQVADLEREVRRRRTDPGKVLKALIRSRRKK